MCYSFQVIRNIVYNYIKMQSIIRLWHKYHETIIVLIYKIRLLFRWYAETWGNSNSRSELTVSECFKDCENCDSNGAIRMSHRKETNQNNNRSCLQDKHIVSKKFTYKIYI